jgi:hypothetical protein
MSGFFTKGTKMKTVTGYEPRFDFDVRRGKVGEDYVGTLLEAIASDSIEVKTDYGSHLTGNLYVEYEQTNQAGVVKPSGISTTAARWWAFAFKDGVIFIETSRLKQLCRDYYQQGRIGTRPGSSESNGTKGVLLPLSALASGLTNNGS